MSLALAFIMTSCSQNGPYKRINIKGRDDGGSQAGIGNNPLSGTTKVENYNRQKAMRIRMPVYR